MLTAGAVTKPDYDNANAQLPTAKASVQSARASVTEAGIVLGYCQLRAPFDAWVLKRNVEVGALVGPATNGFSVVDTRDVKALFGVPDTAMNSIRLGTGRWFRPTGFLGRFADMSARSPRPRTRRAACIRWKSRSRIHAPRFWFSLSPQPKQLNYAQVIVELNNKELTSAFVAQVQPVLSASLPGVRTDFRQLQTNPLDFPVDIRISSQADVGSAGSADDIAQLRKMAAHGGPLWQPLCYAQIGGLSVATFITLLMVPVLYSIFVMDLKILSWDTNQEHLEVFSDAKLVV